MIEQFRCECGTLYNISPPSNIFTTLKLRCQCGIAHVKHYQPWT